MNKLLNTNSAYSPGPVLWPLVAADQRIRLSGEWKPAGSFQISFTNNPGARFTLFMSTKRGFAIEQLDDTRPGPRTFARTVPIHRRASGSQYRALLYCAFALAVTIQRRNR